MTFYDALILQKQTYFVAKFCRKMSQIVYDERPKSIRTWSGVENDSAQIIRETAVPSKAVTTC